uniref:Uncharacterized protein n=1 Tax=Solanum lycopersicum TaxID=4081 RepID=A0A3Q7IEI1_SOLLC
GIASTNTERDIASSNAERTIIFKCQKGYHLLAAKKVVTSSNAKMVIASSNTKKDIMYKKCQRAIASSKKQKGLLHLFIAKRAITYPNRQEGHHIQTPRNPSYSSRREGCYIFKIVTSYMQMSRVTLHSRRQDGHHLHTPRGSSSSTTKMTIIFHFQEGHYIFKLPRRPLHLQIPRGSLHLHMKRGPSFSNAERSITFKCREGHCIQDAKRAIIFIRQEGHHLSLTRGSLHIQTTERILQVQMPRGPLHFHMPRGPSFSNSERFIIFKRREVHCILTTLKTVTSSIAERAIIFICRERGSLHLQMPRGPSYFNRRDIAFKPPKGPSSSNAERAIVFKPPKGTLNLQTLRGIPSSYAKRVIASSNAMRSIAFICREDHCIQMRFTVKLGVSPRCPKKTYQIRPESSQTLSDRLAIQ